MTFQFAILALALRYWGKPRKIQDSNQTHPEYKSRILLMVHPARLFPYIHGSK